MSKWRYERKFIIPDYTVEEIALGLKLHPARFSEIYWQRRVNSLYLDTEELDYAFENFGGSPIRTKVRIRWYGDDVTKAISPTLEIKAKSGTVGTKISAEFPDFDLSQGLTEFKLKELLSKSTLSDEMATKISFLKPTLITSYNRRYFQTFDKVFRITLDFDLAFLTPDLMLKYLPTHYEKNVILELKYGMTHDLEARDLASKLPYRLGRFSKFVRGLQEVWGH